MEFSLTASIPIHFDLYSPPVPGRDRLPLLLALHGYAGNKDSMMRLVRKLEVPDLLIASIQGPYQFMILPTNGAPITSEPKTGFCWRTQYRPEESIALHHQILLSCIDRLVADAQADRSQVFLLGFSQVVAMNYRFVFTHPNIIKGVIGICGGIPGDWQSDLYQTSETDVLHIATDQDEFYPLDRINTFRDKLAQRAAQVELDTYHAEHVVPPDSLPRIADWIAARVK